MLKFLLPAMMILALLVPATPAATPQGATCGALEAYFQKLDALMFEGMLVYVSDEDWQASMERTTKIVNASESGVLALNSEDMQPMVELYQVPSDVLVEFPEEDIPAVAEDFHASALRYWVVMPSMMRSVATGGVMSAMVFSEDLELAEVENAAAIESLQAECPALIAELTDFAETESWDAIFDADAETYANMDEVEAPRGFAFSLMITPSENAEDADEVEDPGDSDLATPAAYREGFGA